MMKTLYFIIALINLCQLTTIFSDELNSLSIEQKTKTYYILNELEKNLYDSEIILNFPNKQTKSYRIHTLKSLLDSTLNTESLENEYKLLNSSFPDLKTTKIDNPVINFFSEIDGKRIASFKCRSLKIGKMLFGPFEIPSNKILIDSPIMIYY